MGSGLPHGTLTTASTSRDDYSCAASNDDVVPRPNNASLPDHAVILCGTEAVSRSRGTVCGLHAIDKMYRRHHIQRGHLRMTRRHLKWAIPPRSILSITVRIPLLLTRKIEIHKRLDQVRRPLCLLDLTPGVRLADDLV